jgi:hypothetical protein
MWREWGGIAVFLDGTDGYGPHRNLAQGLFMFKKYAYIAGRLVFSLWYFCVGIIGFATNNAAKDVTHAATAFERALAETGFMNLLLCAACVAGGGALLFRRTAPLGLVILAPLVIIIFFFHMVITKSYIWGALNLVWLIFLLWHFRRAFQPLWNYAERATESSTEKS